MMPKKLNAIRHCLSAKRLLKVTEKRRRWRRERFAIEQLESRAMLALTFQFNYIKNNPGVGFDNSDTALVSVRKAALEAAAATFGSWFTQSATLKIDVEDFHDGQLDSNGAPIVFVPNTNPGFVKTVAEQKIQNGVDPNGTDSDGALFFNWEDSNPDIVEGSARWNYTDTVGANEMDFKGEVIHNLAHVLGFQSQIEQAGEDIFRDPFLHPPGEPGTWVTYDTFLSDASGAPLLRQDFKLELIKWLEASTSGTEPSKGLFFSGPNAKAANGGNPVPLYSPTNFLPGGTASHLRPTAGVSRSNTLMIAAELGTQNLGLQVRRFTPVEAAMMKDLGYQFDVTPPSVTLSTQTASPTNAPFTVTATISEAISAALVDGNITVTDGAVSNIQKVANNFTFTVTPTTGFNGTLTVAIPANQVQDAAGNKNAASNTLSVVIDTSRPAPFFVSPPTSSSASKVTLTVDFGETVGNFLIDPPVTVNGGSVSNFGRVTLNGKVNSGITFDVTPTTPTSTVEVAVKANAVKDLAGNPNVASAPVSIVFGSNAPSQITGAVYIDLDNDQEKDAKETTLGGVLIRLSGTTLSGDTLTRETYTLLDGSYRFDDLPLGNFIVKMDQLNHYQYGRDSVGPLGMLETQKTFSFKINAANTHASDNLFALRGLNSAFAGIQSSIDASNTAPDLKRASGFVFTLEGERNTTSIVQLRGFDGVRAAELVLERDQLSALLTIVTDTLEVKTTRVTAASGGLLIRSDFQSRLAVQVIGSLNDFNFKTIDLVNPPIETIPNYLSSIRRMFAQEGWGTIAQNPSSSVAPVILVSKNGLLNVQLSVTASGTTDSFDVVLNSPPVNGNVVLDLQTAESSYLQIIEPPGPVKTLTFNSANWNIPQTVVVQGKNDGTPAIVNHQTRLTVSVNTSATTAQNYRSALSRNIEAETIDDTSRGTIIAAGVGPNGAALSIGGSLVGILPILNSLAVGDVTGDGVTDYVLGTAPGSNDFITVWDGKTNTVIRTIYPYPQSLRFKAGVNVALGDVNNDGVLDIIACQQTDKFVTVTDGKTGNILPFGDSAFLVGIVGGASVSSGDLDGDGYAEIILSANVGGGIVAYSYKKQTYTLSVLLRNGVARNIAAGDLNGDGKAEIVASFPDGLVEIFDGQNSLRSFRPSSGLLSVAVDPTSQTIIAGMLENGSTIYTLSSFGELIATSTPFGSSTNGARVAVSTTASTPRTPVPRISISSPVNLPLDSRGVPVTNQATVKVVVDFGEAVTGFTNSGLQVTGGTSELVRETRGLYEFRITPNTPNGLVTLKIPAGAAINVSKVQSAALETPLKIQFDTSRPKPTIRSTRTSDQASTTVTVSFRSGVREDFDPTKLTATNGTISDLKRTGSATFSFTLTPRIRGQQTIISVAAGFARTIAGNPSATATTSVLFTSNPLIPTLSSVDSASTSFSPIPMQVDFGVLVTGFSASTPSITNGTVQSGSVQDLGNGKYEFLVVPNGPGTVEVTIPANLVTDAANSSRKNVDSETLTLEYAPNAPKPQFFALLGINNGVSSVARVPFEVVFSAPVDGFNQDDIQIAGGSIANFLGGDSQSSFLFEVVSNGIGEISLSIPAGVAKDVDQVDNLPSEEFRYVSMVTGDAEVRIESPPSTVRPGETVLYYVTVTNMSVGTVTNAIATAILPSNLSYIPIDSTLSDKRVTASGQTVTINVGDLDFGEQQVFLVPVKFSAGSVANTIESVTVTVTGGNDVNPFNNSSTFSKTVVGSTVTPGKSETIKDATTGGDVTVSVPEDSSATITNVVSIPPLSLPTSGAASAALPVGIEISATSFQVNNAPANSGEIVVTLRPPTDIPPNTLFFKYGKRPGDSVPGIYLFMYDSATGLGAQVFSDRIEIHLKDGQLGDNDGTVNGVIVDPGFLAPINPIAPFQSMTNNLDVDDDGTVSPLDILQIINEINLNGSRELPSVLPTPISKFPFVDTDGDGTLSPLDVLLVINFINAKTNSGSGEGEGEGEGPVATSEPKHTTEVHNASLANATAVDWFFANQDLNDSKDMMLPTTCNALLRPEDSPSLVLPVSAQVTKKIGPMPETTERDKPTDESNESQTDKIVAELVRVPLHAHP